MAEKGKRENQKFTKLNSNISIKCTKKQKLKFDEVVEKTRKSKTDYILEMIDELYRKEFLDK